VNKVQLAEEKSKVKEMMSNIESLTQNQRKELLRLRCRTEFITYAKFITREVSNNGVFTPYRVHKLICDWVQNICDGDPEYKRTAVSLPPRTGKSLLISKLLPSFQLGRSPTSQAILASYALKLTHQNSRAILDFVTSESFKWLFPECTIKRSDCNLKVIRSQQGGIIMSASSGAGVTGFGFGVISSDELPGIGILDDVIEDGNSPQVLDTTWGWVSQQFGTRMLPNFALMSVGTRFHKYDIIGRQIDSDPDAWKVLNVPALCIDTENDPLGRTELDESHWPEFVPREVLESKRKEDEITFNTLYQGRPEGQEGSIFKETWFEQHDKNRENYEYVFATADTALKEREVNDPSVICIFGVVRKTRKLHLLQVYKERMEFPDLLKAMPVWLKTWRVRSLYIESRASGLPLIQMLRRELQTPVREVIPTKDKIFRANEVAPIAKEGRVSIYENIPRLPELMSELCGFPYSKHNDFVDSFCMGLKVYREEIMGSGKTSHGGDRIQLPHMNFQGGFQRITGRMGRNSLQTKYF
jgi:predicted phage terminase large subunit-like protein